MAHSESQYPVSYPAVYTSSCTSSADGAYLPTRCALAVLTVLPTYLLGVHRLRDRRRAHARAGDHAAPCRSQVRAPSTAEYRRSAVYCDCREARSVYCRAVTAVAATDRALHWSQPTANGSILCRIHSTASVALDRQAIAIAIAIAGGCYASAVVRPMQAGRSLRRPSSRPRCAGASLWTEPSAVVPVHPVDRAEPSGR